MWYNQGFWGSQNPLVIFTYLWRCLHHSLSLPQDSPWCMYRPFELPAWRWNCTWSSGFWWTQVARLTQSFGHQTGSRHFSWTCRNWSLPRGIWPTDLARMQKWRIAGIRGCLGLGVTRMGGCFDRGRPLVSTFWHKSKGHRWSVELVDHKPQHHMTRVRSSDRFHHLALPRSPYVSHLALGNLSNGSQSQRSQSPKGRRSSTYFEGCTTLNFQT